MKKTLLSDEDQKKVAATVKDAESRTAGEISTALIPESSDYAFFELRASVVFAMLLFLVQLYFFADLEGALGRLFWNAQPWLTDLFIGVLCLLGGGLFYFFSNIPAIDRLVIPRRIREQRVRHRALRHFTESGVYATAEGTGILVFLSLLERRVEILADKGISARIPVEEWQAIVGDMEPLLRDGKTAEALCLAVSRCGEKLSAHFPIAPDDVNELSDDLVILDE